MAITLTIAGVDRTANLLRVPAADQPLTIDQELKARSTARFQLISTDGLYRPAIGNTVTIVQDSVTLFGGTIDSFTEVYHLGSTAALRYTVNCVDYSQIADRRLVARSYQNQTCGAIIADVVTNDLSGEGVTTTNVDTGPTITLANFNYDSVAQVLDYLSELSGYAWWIDASKNLYFKARDTIAAPFSITDSSANFRNLRVERTREDYRNRQWLKAGLDKTDTIANESPTPQPDGTSRVFIAKYPIAEEPVIKVNGSTAGQDVGILDVDASKAWYWKKNAITVVQDLGQTVLSSTATLTLTYKGLFPIAARLDLESEQEARAAVEGGTGIYEGAREVDLDDSNAALQQAQGLLRKYGTIPTKLYFETDTTGLQASQLLTVNITRHDLSGTWLIDRVHVYDAGRKDNLRTEVLALSGEAMSGWETWFKALAQKSTRLTFRENEIIVRGLTFADTLMIDDSLSVSAGGPGSNLVGTALVGYAEAG